MRRHRSTWSWCSAGWQHPARVGHRPRPRRSVARVNLGHVGFLAELDEEEAEEVVHHIASGDFIIQERMTST